jgi:hypothetical protein
VTCVFLFLLGSMCKPSRFFGLCLQFLHMGILYGPFKTLVLIINTHPFDKLMPLVYEKCCIYSQVLTSKRSLLDVAVKITIRYYMYFYLLFHQLVIFTATSESERFGVCVTLLLVYCYRMNLYPILSRFDH